MRRSISSIRPACIPTWSTNLCDRYLDALDPDGPEPNEQRNQERRSWRMHTTPSGAVVGGFRLTPETGAKAKVPRLTCVVTISGCTMRSTTCAPGLSGQSWHDNGPTDFRNMTLLCSYHHRHFLDRGWLVRINPVGLPEWIPPRYLDPEQKPLINNRIIARIHSG
jgi:hypothetical protein